MPKDSAPIEPQGIAQADRLYDGFPDFSAWGQLSPEDIDLWNRFAANLAERRNEASPETLKAAVEVAVRAAALDTGAIEGLYNVDRGFTMTVAVQGLAWQQMIEERGVGVRELFEAQLAAYELVLDTVTRDRPITEVWIRNLHETLCEPQKTIPVLTDLGWQEQEFPKGQYKTHPNHVRLTDGTFHAYSPVDRVPDEMHRLIEQIRTREFEAAHPILQASYYHYAFVVIHPFADGNGRVARALASTFFYRAHSIPLVIFANQKPAYLDLLAMADRGDHGSLLSFFMDRGIDTMQLVSESLRTAVAPKPAELAKKIVQSDRSWNNLHIREITLISQRILNTIGHTFRKQVQALRVRHLSTKITSTPLKIAPSGYTLMNRSGIRIALESTGTRSMQSRAIVFVSYADIPNPLPFLISALGNDDSIEIRLEDVDPELTQSFLLRLEQWVQRQLGRMLAEIAMNENP